MPNFDGGHYFITVLAPVRTDVLVTDDGQTCSPVSALHRALYVLPTALQSPETERIGINSPFSRCTRTHFARFAILTDVVFNGRNSRNAIQAALMGANPALADRVDQLSCPYLVFLADFDAASGEEAELRSYLGGLWDCMQNELKDIFKSCHGFQGINSKEHFEDYIIRCQVETTMPFSDYWTVDPPLTPLSYKFLVGPAASAALIAIGALLLYAFHMPGLPWGAIAGLSLLAAIASLAFSYQMVMRTGAKPFPAAPNSDLPSVLKAVYLQQAFAVFAIKHQGLDPAGLYEAFGRFLAMHKPEDLRQPTQSPGVVRSSIAS